MIRAVLFDLDGVLRHFDPQHVSDIEQRHGLETGMIHAAAFSAELLDAVTTGEIPRTEWVARVGEALRIPHLRAGAHLGSLTPLGSLSPSWVPELVEGSEVSSHPS